MNIDEKLDYLMKLVSPPEYILYAWIKNDKRFIRICNGNVPRQGELFWFGGRFWEVAIVEHQENEMRFGTDRVFETHVTIREKDYG